MAGNNAEDAPTTTGPERLRCGACSGTGADALGDTPCSTCAGYGYLPNPIRPRPPRLEAFGRYPPCPHCGQTIRPGPSTCPVCGPNAHGRPS